MFSLFRRASHLNGKQPSPLPLEEDIDRTAKLPAPTLRIMGSGPCTYLVSIGKIKFPCPCRQGGFNIQSNIPIQGNEECQECAHPLSSHQDITSSALPQHIRPRSTTKPSADEDPLISKREDTVAVLWEQLQVVRMMHVRGTPASGKSALAELLEAYVKNTRPDICVYYIDWPQPTVFSSEGYNRSTRYYKLLNYSVGRDIEL